ncbi:MAG: alpha-hydroxy-acid oxidizing protein [Oscillospiraceae bacterium]|jgi:isopentenyl diphosphate isomerase/L-lactate dehydrogenase-like FMN-dependent dehydrogenase|nr:alpha-hydroxy-acid oxidizing protein [Oscillospiraceae bacterium]
MEKAGDANRLTRAYFDSLLLEMRHIGAETPDTALTLYGHTFRTPVMTAALSHLERHCPPYGMADLAAAAVKAGAVLWTGMGEEDELERIVATGAKVIKIIKPHKDNGVIFRKIAHAEECGCIAVGMDIDHAFNSRGEKDNVMGLPMAGKNVEELGAFVKATALPFIVKGVMSVRDALLCRLAGARGLVVSHHHGIMDYAVPPLMALPEIVEAVGDAMPVFVDCGVTSGLDVFKALALGATAVSVGRALMGPLTEGGADAAAQRIGDITAQLAGAMARTASHKLAHIERSMVRETGFCLV